MVEGYEAIGGKGMYKLLVIIEDRQACVYEFNQYEAAQAAMKWFTRVDTIYAAFVDDSNRENFVGELWEK